jgi:hypothetical protein
VNAGFPPEKSSSTEVNSCITSVAGARERLPTAVELRLSDILRSAAETAIPSRVLVLHGRQTVFSRRRDGAAEVYMRVLPPSAHRTEPRWDELLPN